jgi:AraC-like DNA-binding protein
MKILQFTLPVPDNKTIITKEESLPHFYPHLHRHNEVQLTWIIKGEGTLITDNNMHSFQNNEIYWIGANQSHVFKSDPSYYESCTKKTHTIDVFFNLESQLNSFFSIPEVKHLKNFIQQHNSGFRVPQHAVKQVSEKILKIHSSSGVEQFFQFIDLLKQLSSIDQLEPLSSQTENVSYSDHEGIRIATIYNYVMQNYNQPITLEEVSKLAYMTPQAFCRYFKKHTHQTLVSFVNQVRINEACKKLVDKKYDSIASVAYNTGFNSITNFNRVFKSVVKKSPKEYLDSYYQNTRQPSLIALD